MQQGCAKRIKSAGFLHNNLITLKTFAMLKTLTFAPRKSGVCNPGFKFQVSSFMFSVPAYILRRWLICPVIVV